MQSADTIIDKAFNMKVMMKPEQGFRLIFSSNPFPKYDLKLTWHYEGDASNYYLCEELMMEDWLCPALLKYFETAPKNIYARLEDKVR